LENRLKEKIEILSNLAKKCDLVFLDYETNTDIENLKKPISHASLVKIYIEETVKVYKAPIQTKLNL
jgi:hypothetical protein